MIGRSQLKSEAIEISQYVSIDKACSVMFPMLITQLESVNTQLEDGVSSLIGGFAGLSKSIRHLESVFEESVEVGMEHSGGPMSTVQEQMARIKRFSDDLVDLGEKIQNAAVNEAVQANDVVQGDLDKKNMSRVILATLDVQLTATEIKSQASVAINAMTTLSKLLLENGIDEKLVNNLQMINEMQLQVNQMLVAFQFQDRVCQIINSVINSMKDLDDYVSEASVQARYDGTEVFLNLAEIKARIESHYVSREQYAMTSPTHVDDGRDVILF